MVRHCVSGGPGPLSAECKLWWSGALRGALLASCRGNFSAEGQYYHMAHTTVLEPDPHVRPVHTNFSKLCFIYLCEGQENLLSFLLFFFLLACFRERLAPQKAGKTALDMDQFRMLFCTCKVPGVKKDTIHNYFKTGRINSALILKFRPTCILFSTLSFSCVFFALLQNVRVLVRPIW